MTTAIHPSAIIADGAKIGADVTIGPYCVIGDHVVIGDHCKLHSHVVIDGHTTLGQDNEIYPFAVIGKAPQHVKYHGEASTLVIGDRNVIRENVTMHPGTEVGTMTTKIGHDNMFFVGCHIAHDCLVGNSTIITNDAMLGGHVEIGDFAYVGGNSAIKQFVRIGQYAMVGGMTGVTADVIPYGNVFGPKASLVGLNLIGLKRRGFDKDQVSAIRRAYRMLFADEGTFSERLIEVEQDYGDIDLVASVLAFIKEGGDSPLCHPERQG